MHIYDGLHLVMPRAKQLGRGVRREENRETQVGCSAESGLQNGFRICESGQQVVQKLQDLTMQGCSSGEVCRRAAFLDLRAGAVCRKAEPDDPGLSLRPEEYVMVTCISHSHVSCFIMLDCYGHFTPLEQDPLHGKGWKL
eukprot:TRINITY_DN29518_c0_g1_i1.p1 TRINITY_DN29518_c0_g1~~TRINITY_DN29518_c0_g1_i1.p1  ORF type:complete len:140 (-),score=6.94 TRINITY_DN29518_c0_g1_i1:44-463(-)